MPDKRKLTVKMILMLIQRNEENGIVTGKYIRAQARSFFFLKPYFTDTFPDIYGSPRQLELLVIPVFPNVCFLPGHFLHEL